MRIEIDNFVLSPDSVNWNCSLCKERLAGLSRMGLTLAEALKFMQDHNEPMYKRIVCEHCKKDFNQSLVEDLKDIVLEKCEQPLH